MRIKIKSSFTVFICLFLISFSVKKEKKINPPGTIYLNDNLYIDKSPVFNIDIKEMEFFFNNINCNEENFQSIIDTIPYRSSFDYYYSLTAKCDKEISDSISNLYKIDKNKNLPTEFVNREVTNLDIYYSHPAYASWSVVNIDYSLAKKYCEWRTKQVNLIYKLKYKKKNYKKIKYRLPTIKEYENAILKYKDEINSIDYLVKNNSTGSSYYNQTNKTKLIFNNISEYTLEKGQVIGSNFNDSIDVKNYLLIRSYENKEPYIGFRCVCEIIEI